MDVGYDSSMKIVMWRTPKLVNYENSYLWQKWFVRINYVSKWVYGSTLSNYIKKKILKMSKIDHGMIFEYFGQNKVM